MVMWGRHRNLLPSVLLNYRKIVGWVEERNPAYHWVTLREAAVASTLRTTSWKQATTQPTLWVIFCREGSSRHAKLNRLQIYEDNRNPDQLEMPELLINGLD